VQGILTNILDQIKEDGCRPQKVSSYVLTSAQSNRRRCGALKNGGWLVSSPRGSFHVTIGRQRKQKKTPRMDKSRFQDPVHFTPHHTADPLLRSQEKILLILLDFSSALAIMLRVTGGENGNPIAAFPPRNHRKRPKNGLGFEPTTLKPYLNSFKTSTQISGRGYARCRGTPCGILAECPPQLPGEHGNGSVSGFLNSPCHLSGRYFSWLPVFFRPRLLCSSRG
jgi:hypothetical protein